MTRPMHAFVTATVLPCLFVAAGCATSGYLTMTRQQQAAIHSVSIAGSVAVPQTPMVFGPSSSKAGMLFGPLASLSAGSGNNPDSQALNKLFTDHNIDLGAIVRHEFVSRLVHLRAFPEIDVARGDATFELTIESYGLNAASFDPMSPINKPLNPHMRLAGRLTSRSGEVLWQSSAHVSSFHDQIRARLFEDILADPQRTREAFAKTAQMVTEILLKDFGAHPGAFR